MHQYNFHTNVSKHRVCPCLDACRLVSELRGLSVMLSKFPDMDLAGKRMYVDAVRRQQLLQHLVHSCSRAGAAHCCGSLLQRLVAAAAVQGGPPFRGTCDMHAYSNV
jgi:hypothetical protein